VTTSTDTTGRPSGDTNDSAATDPDEPTTDTATDESAGSAAEESAESDNESATEPETPAAEQDSTSSHRFRRPGRLALAATVVTSVLATVVFAAAGVALWYVRAQHDTQPRDNAITVAAREEVVALLSLSPNTVQASLDRVLSGSTGGWRQQFAQEAGQFTQVVNTQQINVTATVTASAIQSADDAHATVLVSADALIKNSQSPQGYPGVYRVLMNLQAQQGAWLVSDLQFVA
jgi:Mce-associated membrane protein